MYFSHDIGSCLVDIFEFISIIIVELIKKVVHNVSRLSLANLWQLVLDIDLWVSNRLLLTNEGTCRHHEVCDALLVCL